VNGSGGGVKEEDSIGPRSVPHFLSRICANAVYT